MKKVFFAFAILTILADLSLAQEWVQTNGPAGNIVNSIIFNKRKDMFVLAEVLLRSTNHGATWEQIGTQFQKGTIGDIISSQSNELFITVSYNYGEQSNVWKSTDNGNSWKKVFEHDFSYHLMASTDSSIYVFSTSNQTSSIFRTTNGGLSWDSTSINYPPNNAYGVDLNGVAFYSANQTVFRSTDKGKSWPKVVNGLTTSGFESFSFAPNGDDYVCAVSGGFSRSTDAGRTWNRIFNMRSDANIHTSSIDSHGRILFVGSYDIQYSDDNCKSWRDFGVIENQSQRFIVPSYLFVADPDSGYYTGAMGDLLYASHPDTLSSPWKPVSIPMSDVSAIISHPDGSVLAVSNYDMNYSSTGLTNGLWRSSDNGNSWVLVHESSPGTPSCFAVDTNNVIAATGSGIFKSTNSGIDWDIIGSGLTKEVSSIVVTKKGYILVSSPSDGIFRSTDNGSTWDQLNAGFIDQKIFSTSINNFDAILAGSNNAIYESTNDGLTWQSLNDTMKGNVNSIVVTQEGNIIVGISGNGIFRSVDNGNTWTQIKLGLPTKIINSLLLTPSQSIFAATDSGIYRLDPGASIWMPLSIGLTTKNILSMTVNSEGKLFAGSDGSGVFKSVETFNVPHGFIGWIDADDVDFDTIGVGGEVCKDVLVRNVGAAPIILKGFVVKDPIPFSIDPLSVTFPVTLQPNSSVKIRVCFHPPQIGTYSSEIDWTTDIADSLSEIMKPRSVLSGVADARSGVEVNNVIPHFTLHPNPVSGNSVTVSFPEGRSQSAALSVYDVLGREVYRNNITAGLKEFEIPIRELSEGIYYVRMSSGGVTATQQFIKMK